MTSKKKDFLQQLYALGKPAIEKGLSRREIRDIVVDPFTYSSNFKYSVNEGLNKNVEENEKLYVRKDVKDELSALRERATPVLKFMLLAYLIAIALAVGAKFLKPRAIGLLSTHSHCLIPSGSFLTQAGRKRVDCSQCANLREFPVVTEMTKEMFRERYIDTIIPLVIKGAANDWPIMKLFNFSYIKNIYTKEALWYQKNGCIYFPYNTDILSLEEAFSMSESRQNYRAGERHWYIGWCDVSLSSATKEVERHYPHPHFLPDGFKDDPDKVTWYFMGWPGTGANLHIDLVQKPAWQAQISGRKTWRLVPSPECRNICHELNVTIERGDIIVVDGENWYHATYVHGDEMALSFGTEFQ